MKVLIPDHLGLWKIYKSEHPIKHYHILTIDPGIVNFCFRLDKVILNDNRPILIQNLKYELRSLTMPKGKARKFDYDPVYIMFRQLVDEMLEHAEGLIIVLVEDQIPMNRKAMKVQRYLYQELFSRKLLIISINPRMKYKLMNTDKKSGYLESYKILEGWDDIHSVSVLEDAQKKDDLSDVVLMEHYFLNTVNMSDLYDKIKD